MTLIPGYLHVTTVNAEVLTNEVSINRLRTNRTVNTKNLGGSKWAGALGGQQFITLGLQGSLSAEKAAALQTAVATGRIDASLQVGEAGEATDGGLHSGTFEISNFALDGNANGEFDWSMDMQSSGEVTYTAASSS